MLFEQFDRLLFLAKGGKTVYFGPVGQQSKTLISYFERKGAPACPEGDNPAEWMLSAIGAAPGSTSSVDWHQAWLDSDERTAVREELAKIKRERPQLAERNVARNDDKHPGDKALEKAAYAEFAAPLSTQFWYVQKRLFQQYWRTPSYIWSRAVLTIGSALFVGLSFINADTSQQGLQNQLLSTFLLLTVFSQLVEQTLPNFVQQRSLYEVRERPSKTYSWKVFILSNIVVDVPWNLLLGTLMFIVWYYPIGYYRNAIPTGTVAERGALMWLFVQQFMMYASTFSIACIAAVDSAETAANTANLLFSFMLIFCGVLAPAAALPGFWIFALRVVPFTYLIEGMLGVAVANNEVVCSATELVEVIPPSGTSCGEHLAEFLSGAGGYILDESATEVCTYCPLASTNDFLGRFDIQYANRWRNFGLLFVYIGFNVIVAIALYWLVRVPKGKGKEQASSNGADGAKVEKKG